MAQVIPGPSTIAILQASAPPSDYPSDSPFEDSDAFASDALSVALLRLSLASAPGLSVDLVTGPCSSSPACAAWERTPVSSCRPFLSPSGSRPPYPGRRRSWPRWQRQIPWSWAPLALTLRSWRSRPPVPSSVTGSGDATSVAFVAGSAGVASSPFAVHCRPRRRQPLRTSVGYRRAGGVGNVGRRNAGCLGDCALRDHRCEAGRRGQRRRRLGRGGTAGSSRPPRLEATR